MSVKNYTYSSKLKTFVLPLMICTLIFAGIYPGLYQAVHWLLFDYAHLFEPSYEMKRLYIPIFFASLMVHFFLWKRITSVVFDKKSGKNMSPFYFMLSVSIILTAAEIFPAYKQYQANKVITIDHVNEATRYPQSRYFKIRNAAADKTRKMYSINMKRSRADQGITMYSVIPLIDTALIENGAYPKVFLTFQSKSTLGFSQDNTEKNRELQKFIEDSFRFIDTTEVATYLYFENVTEDWDSKWYLEAIGPVVRHYAETPVFLAGYPHPVEEKITSDYTNTIWPPVIFTLVLLFLLIFEEPLEFAVVEHKKHDE